MNPTIKISIVTPSYNQGQFIEKTIVSVLNQTYKNIEYILVDGGSTDNTMEIVNRYRDKIDIIISEKDNGQSDAINKGFKLSTGTLVGWINSDDILYPDCVEKIVELYQNHPDGAIYYHSFNEMIDRDGKSIKIYQHIIPDRKYLLKTDCRVIQQGSFYNLDLVKKTGYMDAANHYCMDLDLWLSLLKEGPIYHTQDGPHAGFRIYTGTKTDTGKEKFLKNIYQVLRKHKAKIYYPTMWNEIYYIYLVIKVKKIIHFIKPKMR
ncbi:MAG: glycosyltransferase [Candidatus Symbiothrix sp.]|jgi:glycosyltransferase involved in cell wall biosynthesis|nr:glycosyltransferase [Candidatus Symbiothrix sp.]